MRETRTCGSEGGEAREGLSYPYYVGITQVAGRAPMPGRNIESGSACKFYSSTISEKLGSSFVSSSMTFFNDSL